MRGLDSPRFQMEQVVNGYANGQITVLWNQMGLFLVSDVQEATSGRFASLDHALRVFTSSASPAGEGSTTDIVFDDIT